MADDIIYRIGADTTDLDAAMSHAKSAAGGDGDGDGKAPPRPSSNGEWEKVGKNIKEAEESTKHETFLAEQLKELSAGIGYNIGLWNVGMIVSQKILDAIVEGFDQAVTAETQFVQLQNVARLSIEDTKKEFDGLKEAAKAANIDFEKTAVPMAKRLYEVGVPLDQINEDVKTLGAGLRDTGQDFTDIYAKAKLGEAGISDFLKAGDAMGPTFKKAALEFQHLVEQSQIFERNLQATRRTSQRQHEEAAWRHEDLEFQIAAQERLNAAQLGFSDKIKASGLAGAGKSIGDQLLAYFGRAGTFRGAEYGIKLDLPHGLGSDFAARQIEVVKKQLSLGLGQVAKEQNISMREASLLANAGVIDTQMLMQAAQRAKEEERIQRERSQELENRKQVLFMRDLEDQEVAHTNELENTRRSLNEQISNEMMLQLKTMHGLSEEGKTVNAGLDKAKHSTDDAAQSLGDWFQQYKEIQRNVPQAEQEKAGIIPGGALRPTEARPGAPMGLGLPQGRGGGGPSFWPDQSSANKLNTNSSLSNEWLERIHTALVS